MKKIFYIALVLFTSLLVSCGPSEEIVITHQEVPHYTPNGSSATLQNCTFTWAGNEEGVITYEISSSNKEKSENLGIRLFLDEKEIVALKENELPYKGILVIKKESRDHAFKFEVGTITPEYQDVWKFSVSVDTPIPFSVTFD